MQMRFIAVQLLSLLLFVAGIFLSLRTQALLSVIHQNDLVASVAQRFLQQALAVQEHIASHLSAPLINPSAASSPQSSPSQPAPGPNSDPSSSSTQTINISAFRCPIPSCGWCLPALTVPAAADSASASISVDPSNALSSGPAMPPNEVVQKLPLTLLRLSNFLSRTVGDAQIIIMEWEEAESSASQSTDTDRLIDYYQDCLMRAQLLQEKAQAVGDISSRLVEAAAKFEVRFSCRCSVCARLLSLRPLCVDGTPPPLVQ